MKNETFVIATKSHGYISVCQGTVENAMQIFDNHKDVLPEIVLDIANSWREDSKIQYISFKSVMEAVAEIYNLDNGVPAVKYSRVIMGLREPAEYVSITDEMKSELALWMFKNKYSVDKISAQDLDKLTAAKFWELAIFKPMLDRVQANGKTFKLYDYPDYYEMARQYRVITESKWKEGISEMRKVEYILMFVNEGLVDRSDQEYFACDLDKEWC